MIGELLYIAEPASFQNLLGDEVRFFNLVNGEAARCYGGRSGRCETVVDCGDMDCSRKSGPFCELGFGSN